MTIKEAAVQTKAALADYYDSREASAITDLVLEELTGYNRVDRILHDKDPLTATISVLLQNYIRQLQQKMPVQYVLGYAYFAGLKLKVNNQVLIPRPETEELVEWVSETLKMDNAERISPITMLDIGTGSGCIPLALKSKHPGLDVRGCDISDGALGVARQNARLLGLDVHFFKLDILSQAAAEQLPALDYIVTNPPYIDHKEQTEMEPHVLNYEPHLALFPDPKDEPIVFYRRIGELASVKLKKGGHLFMEINPIYVNDILQMLKDQGFEPIEIRKDLQGRQRMVKSLMKN